MDGRISFDVYVLLTDPHFRVDFVPEANQVEVTFGGPSICDEPVNMLNLWFRSPEKVLDFARELVMAGTEFALRREGHAGEAEGATGVEDYPVPRVKSDSDSSAQPDSVAGEGRDSDA